MKLYQAFASALVAMRNCVQNDNVLWRNRWSDRIDQLEKLLPSGSGFDAGSKFLLSNSNESRITIHTSFHHMDMHGGYEKWTEHNVIVTPTFGGINVRVTGRNHNQIKDYISDTFYDVMMSEAPPYPWEEEK